MTATVYRYPSAGLGSLLVIPWFGLVMALALAYLVFLKPQFLVPSTLPAGYFGLLLALVTSAYFFRFDWHRRHHFEPTDAGLVVIGPRDKRELTAWSEFTRADYRTNTGALLLARGKRGRPVVLYPAALLNGSALVATIDSRTRLGLAQIIDLQAALLRAG
jgi:hypothetical protein